MTHEPLRSETVYDIEEVHETLRIRLPRSAIAEMDREIAADARYHGSRSEFVYCAVGYVMYCLQFETGLEWLEEESETVAVVRDVTGP